MNLLSINNYHYRRGGAEVVYLEHNRLFDEAGWKVVPFAMQHRDNLASDWSGYFVDEIEFGRDYSFYRKLLNTAKIAHSFEAKTKLSALVEKTQPDVAHAHNVYHHISPSIFFALRKKRIPVALTLHDLKIACPAYKMLSNGQICERCKGGGLHNVIRHRCVKNSFALSGAVFLESFAQRILGSYRHYVDRFVVPSKFYISKLVEWGWARERFTYIPNFVDTSSLPFDSAVGESFLYFGRLGPEKGLETLIRAANKAGVRLVLVGAGPQEAKLRQLAAQLGSNVEFAGYRSGEDLHALIHNARAVVLPSEWYENAPVSVMEAYALGRPVIGADIGGIPELVKVGEAGDVFESADVDSLAALLDRYRQAPDSRISEMGANGRRWMQENFSRDHYRDRVLALYREMGVSS